MCLGREVNRALEPKAPLWQAGSLPSQLLYCSACVRACAVGVGVWGVGVGVGVGGWGWGVQDRGPCAEKVTVFGPHH
jgi:hypothetical protein